ncbi:glycoside hydrolase family 3 protein [Clostridium sp. SHJSY1]|uniref:glycoside hydrolase family 3 protein n=1 Tax=Clostridium sp. SHJSY1 TaxID=2942483 RepID=UPI00287643EA|nr:glycoside hydrolase family 3 N-terminal domain-containing protein [Clostridium sp. SHJSY1]MDS0524289.1 glycoside hydrolase family 3 protein [Clostridium sp. SHJSY1]
MSYIRKEQDGFILYENENGPAVGTSSDSVLVIDGLIFKDLAKTGELLPYEDWRLDVDVRAKDLASRLSVEQIAGLMMYSPHQMIPSLPGEPFESTYEGMSFLESGKQKWEMTDGQKRFLKDDNVRHVLVVKLENAEVAARWNNEMQKYVENLPFGIPINFSSDPRHGSEESTVEFKSSAEDASRWPEGLGMAAIFSPEMCKKYAEIISKEYRALGLITSLSPQVDLATEPRWMRFEDTWGSHSTLVSDYARAYCDGMQTTEGKDNGWGEESVCTMSKHWPGGGTCEGGRDAHYPFGKYAVYPGENFEMHLQPFLQGAFSLDGPTKTTSAVMPYYTVSWNVDKKNGKNVGNSYSEYLIKDLLREKYGYDGIVCTDWGITEDPDKKIDSFGSRCYGVEDLSEVERHLLAIENGVDQFGGNSDMKPILSAYKLGCVKYGEETMRARIERSAVRLLRNIFRCGLFENPYLNVETTKKVVGSEENCKAGYDAQLKSIVMLKNKEILPIRNRKKVYIPKRHIKARKTFFRTSADELNIDPVSEEVLGKYYDRVEDIEEADFALVFIESPLSNGYSEEDVKSGGNGYLPVSLQYRPYTAQYARNTSVAGGDFREKTVDRGYYGKTNTVANEEDLDIVINTKKKIGNKPVIVCIHMHNPTVLSELEPYSDAILVDFGIQKTAILDIIRGKEEPYGLLPVQMPASMKTVEKHNEDVPFDMDVYKDAMGNSYDFGFGLNWNGKIQDERTKRYVK